MITMPPAVLIYRAEHFPPGYRAVQSPGSLELVATGDLVLEIFPAEALHLARKRAWELYDEISLKEVDPC